MEQTNTNINSSKPFRVVEGTLHDMNHYDFVADFDTMWEAQKYVDENDDRAFDSGYCLFIEKTVGA